MKKLIAGLITLLMVLPSAYAQEEVDPNSVQGKINHLFEMTRKTGKAFVKNENVQATIKTTKEVGKAAWDSKSKLVYPSDSYCAILQNSEEFQEQFWFTDVLGAFIQKALLEGDQYVIDRMPDLFFIVKKKDLDFIDTTGFNPFSANSFQIEELKAQIFEPIDEFDYSDFDTRWDAYFSKDLTFFVHSYRCSDDHWLHDGQALHNAIEAALDIAIHLGDKKARSRLQPYLPY